MSSSTTISIPDQIQIVGEPGSFYTIVSLDSLGPDSSVLQNSRIVLEDGCPDEKAEEEEEEGDILLCGKCKAHYSDVEAFVQHKKTCSRDQAKKVETEVVHEEQELYYAVEPEVLDSKGSAGLTEIYLTTSQLVPIEKPQEQTISKVKAWTKADDHESSQKENSSERKIALKKEDKVEPCVDQKAPQDDSKSKKLFCSYCQKGFNKVFDLTQHTRSHTGGLKLNYLKHFPHELRIQVRNRTNV